MKHSLWQSLGTVAFAGLTLFASSGEAGAITIAVTPSSLATSASTFSVSVAVDGVSDLYAYQFDVGFDPTLLAAVSESEGGFLPSGGATVFLPGMIDNVGGTIAFTAGTLLSAVAGVSGSGMLAVLNFHALAAGTSTINVFNAQLLDSNLNGLSFTTSSSEVTTSPAAGLPEPASLALLGLGVSALWAGRRRSNRTTLVA